MSHTITITPGDGQLSLQWGRHRHNPGAGLTTRPQSTYYRVFRNTSSNVPWTNENDGVYGVSAPENGGPSSFSWTDTGVTNGVTYYYRVVGYRGGTRDTSPVASGTPMAAGDPPANAPTGLSGSRISNTSLSASWNAVTGDGTITYRLGYWTSSVGWLFRDTSGTSVTLTGLVSEATYFLSVRAENEYGNSAYSHESNHPQVALAAPQVSAPSTPSAPSVSQVDQDSLSASWSSVTGATSYNVRWRVSGSGDSWSSGTSSGTSRSINGLMASTTYEVQIQAVNSGGTSGWSSSGTGTTAAPPAVVAPATPSAPSVSEVDHDSLSASWSAVTGATSYNLRWRVSGSGDSWSGGTSSGTSRSINGLMASTTYEVQVQAVNSVGTSGWSSSGTGTTSATPVAGAPDTPSTPSVSQIDHDSLSVSWSSVTGATSYGVRYRVNGSGDTYSTTSTSGTSITINGLSASTTYEVQIQARNSVGNSDWSSSGTGSTGSPPVVVPGSVSSLSVSNISHDSFTISWNAPSSGGSPTGYHVQYKRDDATNYTSASDAISPSTVTGLDSNTDYDIQVRAYNSAGNGPWESTTATTPNRPSFPLSAVAGDGQVTLSWGRLRMGTFSGGNHYYAAAYRVYRYNDGDDLSESRFKNSPGSQIGDAYNAQGDNIPENFTHVDNTAVNGTQYWYQVGASRGFQTGTVTVGTNVVGPRTPMAEVPAAPATPSAPSVSEVDHDSLSASWSAVTGATSYNVRWRVSGSGSSWSSGTSSGTSRSYKRPHASSTTYEVQIQAVNSGGTSDWSSSGTGTTATPPTNAPSTPSAPSVSQIDHDSLSVSWSSVTGATSYGVRYRVNGSGDTYSTASSSGTSITINGLSASTTYEVQIQARNSVGNSDWSSSGTGSTGPPLVVVPGSVSSLAVSNISHDQFTISWAAPSSGGSPTGYHVQYKRDDATNYTSASDAISPSTVTGLNSNTDYDIQVRAYNSAGNGPWESTTATTP